nr:DUF3467 domain-containing protein [Desulfobacula sp.]
MEKKVFSDERQQDETKGQAPEQAGMKPLRFMEDGVKTQYAGIFNIGLGTDEAILIFGNPSLDQSMVRIESKVAVSLKTAKRLAITLANLIQRYEEKNGVLDISRPQPVQEKSE